VVRRELVILLMAFLLVLLVLGVVDLMTGWPFGRD
jgi:hypothetical protein